jgi:hypothetical protein
MRAFLALVAVTAVLSSSHAFAQDQQKEEIKKEETVPKSGSAGGRTEPDQNAKQEGSSKISGLEPNAPIFVDGRLTVPGAPDGDTVPSVHSARTFADDQLPIAAYATRYLTNDQMQTIRSAISNNADASFSRALDGHAEIGALVPTGVVLKGMQSLPPALAQQIPSLAGTAYVISENKVLLVNPRTRVVIGVIE